MEVTSKYKCCPFCGSIPRYLEFKAGFYTERVICDNCNFYLPPEIWEVRVNGSNN